MLLKWEMENEEWGMGNGEWGMGNGKLKWEIENGKLSILFTLTFYTWNNFFTWQLSIPMFYI